MYLPNIVPDPTPALAPAPYPRAFGDFEFKSPDMDQELCKVTALPDIVVHTRTPSDDILLIACDGVWDVLSSEDAVELARDIMLEGEVGCRAAGIYFPLVSLPPHTTLPPPPPPHNQLPLIPNYTSPVGHG
jgi:hypothetical protein